MIDVKNCRCKHPGCTRQPNYGHEGGRAKFCSSHKLEKMVNVVSRRCEFPGCKRQVILLCFFVPYLNFALLIIIVHRETYTFTGRWDRPLLEVMFQRLNMFKSLFDFVEFFHVSGTHLALFLDLNLADDFLSPAVRARK